MAERRMFTKKITDSDSFISLSSSAQALYLHLNQGADDDGFNNQVQIAMLKAHASSDDLAALLGRGFLYQFEGGVVVVKHWRMHNTLRKDRYNPTSYQDEFSLLSVKENGSYTLVAKRLPDGCQTVATGKYSKGEDSKVKTTTTDSKDNYIYNNGVVVVVHLLEQIKGQPLTGYECEKLKDLVDEYGAQWVEDALRKMADNGKIKLSYAEGILHNWKTEGRDATIASAEEAKIKAWIEEGDK